MCLRLDSTEIPIIADTTTPKLVKLESKKSHEKFSFGKRLRRKKNEIKNRKCSYGNIWWLIIIMILLSTSAPCWSRCSGLIQTTSFFSASRICLTSCGVFFRAVYTQNISMSQVEINLFSCFFFNTFYSLSRTTIANSTKSLSILHTASQCFQFYRFSVLAHWRRWWWRARESSVTSPTQGSTITGCCRRYRWSSIPWRTQNISLNWIILIDENLSTWCADCEVCCDI